MVHCRCVFWSPWDRPYKQSHGPDQFGLNAISTVSGMITLINGRDGARDFGKPMVVSFGNEMNGDWFPWSGWYYGADNLVDDVPNQWEGPERFKTGLSLCG